MRSLLDEGVEFDAVFTLNDTLGLGALRALGEAGVRVPEDVAVHRASTTSTRRASRSRRCRASSPVATRSRRSRSTCSSSGSTRRATACRRARSSPTIASSGASRRASPSPSSTPPTSGKRRQIREITHATHLRLTQNRHPRNARGHLRVTWLVMQSRRHPRALTAPSLLTRSTSLGRTRRRAGLPENRIVFWSASGQYAVHSVGEVVRSGRVEHSGGLIFSTFLWSPVGWMMTPAEAALADRASRLLAGSSVSRRAPARRRGRGRAVHGADELVPSASSSEAALQVTVRPCAFRASFSSRHDVEHRHRPRTMTGLPPAEEKK